ncbi:hypothetical protein Tco_1440285 [Tanacetum coccineum]
MSVRLIDRSFQYPVGITKNMLVEVGEFTFPADLIILKMEEDSKVPPSGDLFFTIAAMQLVELNRNNSILELGLNE